MDHLGIQQKKINLDEIQKNIDNKEKNLQK